MKHLTLSILLAMTLALVAQTANAQIREVDCSGATPYPDVTSALVGITPGTTIVVHPCSYPDGFAISGLTDIQVVAADVPGGMIGAWAVGLGTFQPTSPIFVDFDSSCVVIKDSHNISIVGLAFEYCLDDGFTIDKSTDILIDGNAVYTSDASGVALHDSEGVEVVGNHLYYARRAGVEVFPGVADSQISRNRLEGNEFGILMDGKLLDVVGNEIRRNNNTGILVRSTYSTVSRNTVYRPSSGAPSIDFTATPAGTCVAGNDLFGGGVTAPPGACEAENN